MSAVGATGEEFLPHDVKSRDVKEGASSDRLEPCLGCGAASAENVDCKAAQDDSKGSASDEDEERGNTGAGWDGSFTEG